MRAEPLHRPTLGAGVLTVAAAAVTVMAVGSGGYTRYVLALVLISVIAALSLNVLMGYAGQISLGQAAFVGVGAFAAAQYQAWGLPFLAVLPAAVATTALAATVVGLPSLRIRGLQLAVTSLAFGVVAERLIFTRPWAAGSSTGAAAPRPDLVAGDGAYLALTAGALAVIVVADLMLRRSRVGRALFAVRDREDTAAASGVPVARTKLLAYAISGTYAGVAGALYAFLLERITPGPFTVWASLGYVAIVVVGGLASFSGVIVAAVAFTALPELLRPAATWAPLTGAVALMLMPVLRPEGLGWLLDRPLRLRRRSPARPGPEAAAAPAGDAAALAALAPPRRSLRLAVPVRDLLTVEGLHLSYGGNAVLTGVDFTVRRGERLGLIGPNGAGKTTIFNCVSGFVRPKAGAIRYRDLDLLSLPPEDRPSLGLVRTFQQVGLSPRRTVWDNVLACQHSVIDYGLAAALTRSGNVRRSERLVADRAEAALHLTGLADLAAQQVIDLPHGQQRLAEVAAAAAAGPELLLLDEPAAGMSPEEAEHLSALLDELARGLGLTLLVIDHHVPFVTSLCDRLVVLSDGQVIASGRPEAVTADPQVVAVYLGTSPPAAPGGERPEPALEASLV
jgi:branched-chain amino acid transport system permease protein